MVLKYKIMSDQLALTSWQEPYWKKSSRDLNLKRKLLKDRTKEPMNEYNKHIYIPVSMF